MGIPTLPAEGAINGYHNECAGRDHQLKGAGDAVEQGDEGEGPEACLVGVAGCEGDKTAIMFSTKSIEVYFASVKARAAIVTCGGLTNSGAETNTVRPQVHDGGSGAMAMDEGQGANKGVFVNEYLVKTLSPEDEGKALSDQNHHTSSLLPLNTDGFKLI
ncbi:hypothetical protein Tco_0688483 [Tanacetum coccineum]